MFVNRGDSGADSGADSDDDSTTSITVVGVGEWYYDRWWLLIMGSSSFG
jgi:hypothetical protein